MYKHILLPTDGSPLSETAVRQGIALAKSLGARTTAITVSPTFHTFVLTPTILSETPQEYEKACEARAGKYLAAAAAMAGEAGVPCQQLHVIHDHPYEAIIEAAKNNRCDLIFMASHGRTGIACIVLGSETTRVLTHSKIPVLVCR